MRRLTRDARVTLARLPAVGKVPIGPTFIARSLIPGDPGRGVRLLRDELEIAGARRTIGQEWDNPGWTSGVRGTVQGFTWMRDLAALGTAQARTRARALVSSWLAFVPHDPTTLDAPIIGERIASLLAHYDFYAASAEDSFRQALMTHLVIQARIIAALLPLHDLDWSALTAMRGLLAAAIAMPDHAGFLHRFTRYIDGTLDRLILPDGCLTTRSPEAQLQAIRELTEMRIMFQTAKLAAPHSIILALDRLTPVLRALRHGDGGLALFNGASEHSASRIDAILSQASQTRVAAGAMPNGGFTRIVSGRSVLIMDSGVPAPSGFDQGAHAGTLSLEFSVGRQRIFTNCGASPLRGWDQMLRQTAAHTVMTLENLSSADFAEAGGLSRRPVRVEATHQTQDGAHWLDASHDGYRASVGATYRRRLYLNAEGTDLRGEETIEGEKPVEGVLRFHLHPSVTLEFESSEEEIILRAGQGGAWRFVQEGGVLSVEESVYFGGARPTRTAQITITMRPPAAGSDKSPEAAEHETPPPAEEVAPDATLADRPNGPARMTLRPVPAEGPREPVSQTVRWVMMRIDTDTHGQGDAASA